jgi:ureidoacrylate peracid hydrolase
MRRRLAYFPNFATATLPRRLRNLCAMHTLYSISTYSSNYSQSTANQFVRIAHNTACAIVRFGLKMNKLFALASPFPRSCVDKCWAAGRSDEGHHNTRRYRRASGRAPGFCASFCRTRSNADGTGRYRFTFMDDDIGHIVVPAAREIVPNVNRLAVAVRSSGGGVFWLRQIIDGKMWDDWTVMGELSTPEMQIKRVSALAKNSPGVDLWPELDVRQEDEVLSKTRFSAFLPGSSALPDRLRARKLDTVIIVGTVTNVCCDSSARDAMMTNFRAIMVSDANAAATQAEHDAALMTFYCTFGDVLDTEELITILQQRAAVCAARSEI